VSRNSPFGSRWTEAAGDDLRSKAVESAAWLVGTPGGGFPIPAAAALEARARPPQQRRLRLEPTEEFASGQVRELQPIR